MSPEIAKDINAIVQKLKETARAHPWYPFGIPPREHYHVLPNGLSLCFTLDVLPGFRIWHLSIARVPDGATPEEVEFWRRAFFDQPPTLDIPSPLSVLQGRHFYWMIDIFTGG